MLCVEDRQIEVDGGEIPIRCYRPVVDGDPDKTFALFVWFHGGGARPELIASLIVFDELEANMGANHRLYVPQCRDGRLRAAYSLCGSPAHDRQCRVPPCPRAPVAYPARRLLCCCKMGKPKPVFHQRLIMNVDHTLGLVQPGLCAWGCQQGLHRCRLVRRRAHGRGHRASHQSGSILRRPSQADRPVPLNPAHCARGRGAEGVGALLLPSH